MAILDDLDFRAAIGRTYQEITRRATEESLFGPQPVTGHERVQSALKIRSVVRSVFLIHWIIVGSLTQWASLGVELSTT
jgi:hypothetical protein